MTNFRKKNSTFFKILAVMLVLMGLGLLGFLLIPFGGPSRAESIFVQIQSTMTMQAQFNNFSYPIYLTRVAELKSPTRPSSTNTPPIPVKTKTSDIDGTVLVNIPAGTFVMGEPGKLQTVFLDEYWIDQLLVTNANYLKCVQSGKCPDLIHTETLNQHFLDPRYANHPVVYVNWFNAVDYCEWVGGHLPTEAQWEKAARGTDGRLYPWGDAEPNSTLLNFNKEIGETTEVGSYPAGASPYGLLDMAGNVRQWIADWYSATYYDKIRAKNPLGPPNGIMRVLKGGSWADPGLRARSDHRLAHDPTSPGAPRGFRCVR